MRNTIRTTAAALMTLATIIAIIAPLTPWATAALAIASAGLAYHAGAHREDK